MAGQVEHKASVTADSDGIYLDCSCGQSLGVYQDPILAPYSDINARVMVHSFQVLGQALAAALAPILDPPKRRDFKLVPPGILPQLPPGKEE